MKLLAAPKINGELPLEIVDHGFERGVWRTAPRRPLEDPGCWELAIEPVAVIVIDFIGTCGACWSKDRATRMEHACSP
jgi:hypothetical protein